MKKHKKKYHVKCSVTGCHRESAFTFAKGNEISPNIRVCVKHMKMHKRDRLWSIWEHVPIHYTPRRYFMREARIAREKKSGIPSDTARVKGISARRGMQMSMPTDCEHPREYVMFDKLYRSKRCLFCGKRVKKVITNKGTRYKTSKIKKVKPVLEQEFIKGDMRLCMCMYLFEKGLVDANWENAIKIARAILPGTKFNTSTFSWYRSYFIKRYILRKEKVMSKLKKHKKHVKVEEPKKDTSKAKKKKAPKKETIRSIVFGYFEEVGVEKASFADAKKRVLKVHPESAFNEQHMGWYKNEYKKNNK